MKDSIEVLSNASAHGMKRPLRGMVPLGCLLLTCCMGETVAVARQDVEPGAKPATVAAAPQQVQPQPTTQLAGSMQAPTQVNQDVADVVREGRLLLAEKSSKPDAKKSKSAKDSPSGKRLDASKEAEEEDDDEEDEDEDEGKAADSSGKGSGELGKHSIQADFDKNVTVTLKEVVARGAVLSVTVSLNFQGGEDKKQSENLSTSDSGSYTHVLDYETGKTYSIMKNDGFTGGRLHQGQGEKTLRSTFAAPPKSAKTIAITMYGIGTFDDVKLGGGPLASSPKGKGEKVSKKPNGSSEAKAEEEEDDEDDDEDDDKSLAGKNKKETKKKGK